MITLGQLKKLNTLRYQRQTVFLLHHFQTDISTLYGPDDIIPQAFKNFFIKAQKTGNPVEFQINDQDYFLNPFVPNLEIIVIGAVHISQALTTMAQQCGYSITIIDPREAFAAPARFPHCKVITQWPEDYFKTHPLDRNNALIALTHNPDIDDAAIINALNNNAFYVGALGSRKTHEKRKARLLEYGLSQSKIDKIHAPIGLDIDAITPAEIAVSILSQLILCWRNLSHKTDDDHKNNPEAHNAAG